VGTGVADAGEDEAGAAAGEPEAADMPAIVGVLRAPPAVAAAGWAEAVPAALAALLASSDGVTSFDPQQAKKHAARSGTDGVDLTLVRIDDPFVSHDARSCGHAPRGRVFMTHHASFRSFARCPSQRERRRDAARRS